MNIGPYDLDDTLLPAARDTGTPQLALYQYDRVAVVVGRGGNPQREVDLAAAARSGVPVLRRPGGGCAVVLDRGNLVVSLALPLPGLGAIRSAFNAISDWMIAGLSACGVSPVTQRGPQEFRSGLEPALRQELTALWTTCRGFILTETA
jgi:lipoate-protein ligase A